jgi:hypothetical protein
MYNYGMSYNLIVLTASIFICYCYFNMDIWNDAKLVMPWVVVTVYLIYNHINQRMKNELINTDKYIEFGYIQ